MKKLLSLILSSIITLSASASLALDYTQLQTRRLNIYSGGTASITVAMPNNSIQPIEFNANRGNIISVVPGVNNGYNNVTLRVYDSQGKIIANQFGAANETYLVFEAPSTGTFELYIVTSQSMNYSYTVKIE